MTERVDITIIGAGVVGCSIAYELSRVFPDDNIIVVEKNLQINGENQSSRNSGVIHAGIFYNKKLSPLKAKLCLEGNRLLYEFCKKNNVLHKNTGKIVVATEDIEIDYLNDVLKIAKENGVEGIRELSSQEIKQLEPNIFGIAGLYVPSSGIVETTQLINKLSQLAEANGVIFLTGNKVENVRLSNEDKSLFTVTVKSTSLVEEFNTRVLINCAGLYSDEISKLVNPKTNYEIQPIKGDYAKFYCLKRKDIKLNGLNVYPVPFGYYSNGERAVVSFDKFLELLEKNEVTKSLGVHLSPTFDLENFKSNDNIQNIKNSDSFIHNTIIIGPAYSKPENKEDYKNSRDVHYFYKMIKPFFPNINIDDISLHQTGIRAKLKNFHDFVIEQDVDMPNFINLVGIDSPGLTSCLAIAKYILPMVKNILS